MATTSAPVAVADQDMRDADDERDGSTTTSQCKKPSAPPPTFSRRFHLKRKQMFYPMYAVKNGTEPIVQADEKRPHFLPARTTEKFLEANARFCRQYGQKNKRRRTTVREQHDEYSEASLTVTSCSSGASDSSASDWENEKFDKTVISKAKLIHQKDRPWRCYWDLSQWEDNEASFTNLFLGGAGSNKNVPVGRQSAFSKQMSNGIANGNNGAAMHQSSGSPAASSATVNGHLQVGEKADVDMALSSSSTSASSSSADNATRATKVSASVQSVNNKDNKKTFFDLMDGHKRHRKFVVCRNFMTGEEIKRIDKAFENWSTAEIKDRKQNLKYKHVAYRCELELKYLEPELYGRILECVHLVDDTLWQKMPRCTYPELEYIVYDTRRPVRKKAVLEEEQRAKAQLTTFNVEDEEDSSDEDTANKNGKRKSTANNTTNKPAGAAASTTTTYKYQPCHTEEASAIANKWKYHSSCVQKAGESGANSYVARGERRPKDGSCGAKRPELPDDPEGEEDATNTGYIEEHVDNDSVITFILMLTQPGVDYVGGRNNFARGEKHAVRRQVQLQKGDLVLFRGERLRHSITPVTHGCRIILQGEFSKT
ncbi:unnamed protein product [Amoebophrya sp. A120]|nr:unnamed protein product [Amoebophrya sp. A120]|eukprot:GSA120T00017855001.1